VAQQLRRRLEAVDLLADGRTPGVERYFTSGVPERTARVMKRLLAHPVALETLPERFLRGEGLHSPESPGPDISLAGADGAAR
jgi:hypothetical protein